MRNGLIRAMASDECALRATAHGSGQKSNLVHLETSVRWSGFALLVVAATVFVPLSTQMDRFNVNVSLSKNWEHLQSKFVGTGHPDLSRL